QPGRSPARPGPAAEPGEPEHSTAAVKRGAGTPAKYTGEAALPAVTDEMLRDALQETRPYTVCVLKAGPRFQEPGPVRESWLADLISDHAKRTYALYLAGLARVICPVPDGSGTTGVTVFDPD